MKNIKEFRSYSDLNGEKKLFIELENDNSNGNYSLEKQIIVASNGTIHQKILENLAQFDENWYLA